MTPTEHPMNDTTLASLPSWVVARLKEIADEDEYDAFQYHELVGTIDHPYQNISKQINLWIASSDSCYHDIHLGGSACWVRPDNHYIFFHPIAPELLPEIPDLTTWWVIKHEHALEVFKIAVRSESEVTQNCEDL